MSARRTSAGISTPLPAGASGWVGKSSLGSPAILKRLRSHSISVQASGRTLRRRSLSGRDRAISWSFFAPRVIAPSWTTWAGHPQRSETSRSVAEILSSLPFASHLTFERIGMEFLRSTMPWTSWSSRTRSFLRTVISMFSTLSPRTDRRRRRERRTLGCGNGAKRHRARELRCAEDCGRIGAGRELCVGKRRRTGGAQLRHRVAVVEKGHNLIETLARSC